LFVVVVWRDGVEVRACNQ